MGPQTIACDNVLILGIGNVLLSDEGVGVHAVRHLSGNVPPSVDLLDGGTSGANLIDFIEGRPRVVVIDAADGSGPPGTIYRCEAHELLVQENALSLHEFGLVESLQMATRLGCAPKQVVVLGVQPACLDPGLELSPSIAAALPYITHAAIEEALKPFTEDSAWSSDSPANPKFAPTVAVSDTTGPR